MKIRVNGLVRNSNAATMFFTLIDLAKKKGKRNRTFCSISYAPFKMLPSAKIMTRFWSSEN